MSIEAVWDLQSKHPPRSLAVFPASSSNPFEQARPNLACVYGTDRGSLHFRCYAPPGNVGVQSNSQTPLGIHSRNVPREYFPLDLAGGALPGPIVHCVPLKKDLFLILVEDDKGSAANQGTYAAHLVAIQNGAFLVLSSSNSSSALPRMTCAVFHNKAGLVYAAGRSILSAEIEQSVSKHQVVYYHGKNVLPAPGARNGGMELTAQGRLAIVAVGSTFYAIPSSASPEDSLESSKIISFSQSSQVHPVVVMDIHDESLEVDWSSLFLASGRECAVVDIYYGPFMTPRLSVSKPRHGTATLASPILAAASSWPWLAVLTSDGLISVRSPSCLAIPLRTVEVGTRPNDFFVLRTVPTNDQTWIVAAAYSGEARVLACHADSAQDLADRLMRHAIDAFGANGFPRTELAEAVNVSFTATSYVGPEPTPHTRSLLKQYLEAILGLADFESGAASAWPTELSEDEGHRGAFSEKKESGRGAPPSVVSSAAPSALLSGTALLCLVCSQLSNTSLAVRAAKSCAGKMGVVMADTLNQAAVRVCEMVADKLLREASSAFTLSGSSPSPARMHRPSNTSAQTELCEAAVWLLRSCGKHERAIDLAHERLQGVAAYDGGSNASRGQWSQIKYESYVATHLSELWSSGMPEGRALVLKSLSTVRLLEQNPRLGISVFTATHPQNEAQWRAMKARDDPLADAESARQVIKLLKSTTPLRPSEKSHSHESKPAPLDYSGRALAVTFLESAIGIATGRPTESDEFDNLPPDETYEARVSNFHDELSFLLLEGVISERRDDADDEDSEIGQIYRQKLRRLLRWPIAKIRSEDFMRALPASFLEEKALILGRLGKHEEAIRILYRDLDSLELALEYCDDRHKQQMVQRDTIRARQQQSDIFSDSDQVVDHIEEDNAYIPLIRVALESDKEQGTACAIQVLALRQGAIDRAAALRLLPSDVPVSAVARPFLIPALVDSESQVRRLTVVSALLRAKYHRLKDDLTSAQLKAQATLHAVPQLRSLNLGEPLHSTKPFKTRTIATASSTMPDVMIAKYFFPRHLVIQAKVTNIRGGRVLTDISFVVAESSEDAIQPSLQVPIQTLPVGMTGSCWCVLSASPSRMEGAVAQLTCELRYTVLSLETTTGRTYVEELSDLEVNSAHFS